MAQVSPDTVATAPFRLCFLLVIYIIFMCPFSIPWPTYIGDDCTILLDIASSFPLIFSGFEHDCSIWPRGILREADRNSGSTPQEKTPGKKGRNPQQTARDLCPVSCWQMSSPLTISWTRSGPECVTKGTYGTVTFFVSLRPVCCSSQNTK